MQCRRKRHLTSIASKLEIYAIRFSLLLALADWACGGEKKLIDVDTVERTLRLVEYFRSTASKVQGIISEDALTELQLAVLWLPTVSLQPKVWR